MATRATIGIVGAGIAGITTAISLAEAGYRPEVYLSDAAAPCSQAAGGIFLPYFYCGLSDQRQIDWAWTSRMRLREALAGNPSKGSSVDVYEYQSESPSQPADMKRVFPDFAVEKASAYGLGLGEVWRFRSLTLDMSWYMKYLIGLALESGIRLKEQGINSNTLPELGHDILVNCSGSYSASLFPDESLSAIRGQLEIYDIPSAAPIAFGWDDYIVMKIGGRVGLGSLWQRTWNDEEVLESSSLQLHSALAEKAELLKRLGIPTLEREKRSRRAVGFRPYRKLGPRVELDKSLGRNVIHNYGHGGVGFSTAWGTAAEVVEMVRDLD